MYSPERFKSAEERRVERVIALMDGVHEALRFGAKRSIIAHTLGEANPYERYKDVLYVCKDEQSRKVLDALVGLTARIRRHAVGFLQLCETFEDRFADMELALELLKVLKIMEANDMAHAISDKLSRRLVLAKLTLVVDND